MDDSEKNLVSLLLLGLREDLRQKVKLVKSVTLISAYRSAYARELIAITEKRLGKFQAYRSSPCTTLQQARHMLLRQLGRREGFSHRHQ